VTGVIVVGKCVSEKVELGALGDIIVSASVGNWIGNVKLVGCRVGISETSDIIAGMLVG